MNPGAKALALARGFVLTVWMGAIALVLGIVSAPIIPFAPKKTIGFIRLWSRAVLFGLRTICGVTVEVRGLENLPRHGVLIAAKHQGGLDMVAPFVFLSEPAFVMKKELLAIPVFGIYAQTSGQIVIDRDGGAATLRAMIKAVRDRFDQGRQIIIFPEGTRKAPGAPPDYKPGLAGLYRELNIACTPIATNSGECWPPKGMAKYPGRVVFEILPTIPAGMKRAEFMREVETRIEAASQALRQKP